MGEFITDGTMFSMDDLMDGKLTFGFVHPTLGRQEFIVENFEEAKFYRAVASQEYVGCHRYCHDEGGMIFFD